MGEAGFSEKPLAMAVEEALVAQSLAWSEGRIATAGGRFQVRWDENGSASALGQLVFFAEFLEVSGLFERWVAGCPLAYRSPNSPQVQDVLGTWFLSILDGQWRYAHITGLRGDAVSPQILGMTRILSDESLRRALKHLAPSPDKAKTEEDRARREAQLSRRTKRCAKASAKRWPRAGFSIATPRSNCSMDTKPAHSSAITRSSRGVPVTPSTPTGSPMYASSSTPKSKKAQPRRPSTVCRVSSS